MTSILFCIQIFSRVLICIIVLLHWLRRRRKRRQRRREAPPPTCRQAIRQLQDLRRRRNRPRRHGQAQLRSLQPVCSWKLSTAERKLSGGTPHDQAYYYQDKRAHDSGYHALYVQGGRASGGEEKADGAVFAAAVLPRVHAVCEFYLPRVV